MGQLSRELLSAQRLAKKLDRGEDPVAIVGDHVVYRGSKLKIVEVKEEVVAGEKVLTYRTSEGASFQYWTKQRRITTPFRVEWYQLSPTNRLFVEPTIDSMTSQNTDIRLIEPLHVGLRVLFLFSGKRFYEHF
ncbi:MAG: hypothetical protein QXX41_10730 [Nitrososphaerota archaeon]